MESSLAASENNRSTNYGYRRSKVLLENVDASGVVGVDEKRIWQLGGGWGKSQACLHVAVRLAAI